MATKDGEARFMGLLERLDAMQRSHDYLNQQNAKLSSRLTSMENDYAILGYKYIELEEKYHNALRQLKTNVVPFDNRQTIGANTQYNGMKKKTIPNAQLPSDSTMEISQSSDTSATISIIGNSGQPKIFECLVCKLQFATVDAMQEHMAQKCYQVARNRLMSAESDGSSSSNLDTTCVRCHRVFSKKSYLQTHYQKTGGESMFICAYDGCGMVFAYKCAFNQHRAGHGSSPCTYPGCGKILSNSRSLLRHNETHLRKIKCEKFDSSKASKHIAYGDENQPRNDGDTSGDIGINHGRSSSGAGIGGSGNGNGDIALRRRNRNVDSSGNNGIGAIQNGVYRFDDDDDDDLPLVKTKKRKKKKKKNKATKRRKSSSKCLECLKIFRSRNKLLAHQKLEHRGTVICTRPIFKCSIEGSFLFANIFSLYVLYI